MTTWSGRRERDTVPDRLGDRLEPLRPCGRRQRSRWRATSCSWALPCSSGCSSRTWSSAAASAGAISTSPAGSPIGALRSANDLSLVGSAFAETATVLVSVAIVLIVLAVKRHWPLFGFVALTLMLEGGVYAAATYAISRNRPAVPRLEDLIVTDSFPSGHTAAAVALYGSLAIVVWAETRQPRPGGASPSSSRCSHRSSWRRPGSTAACTTRPT